MAVVLRDMRFDRKRLDQAVSPDLFATARAMGMVQEGTPFREAYRRAAGEPDAVRKPPAQEALEAYRVDGYPGQCRPDLVMERLNRIDTGSGSL